MKQMNNYNRAFTYTESERLPIGGYVIKILDVKIEAGKNKYNDRLVISFDIDEGEYKGFFKKNYNSQAQEDKKWKGTARLSIPFDNGSEDDMKTMNRFKTALSRIEESNQGYHWNWDENTLKGKTAGAVFNNKEYDFNGSKGFFTNFYCFASTENIRSGKFKIPADTLLKAAASQAITADGFMNIPDGLEEELPFN